MKYYSNTILYYKNINPILENNYYSNITLYYKIILQYFLLQYYIIPILLRSKYRSTKLLQPYKILQRTTLVLL